MNACVNVYGQKLEIEKIDGDRINYRVVGTITDYYGQKVRPGFETYIFQEGRTPDTLEQLHARFPSDTRIRLMGWRGKVERFPYDVGQDVCPSCGK